MGGENPENELRDNEILLRKKKINTPKGIEDGIGLYERDLNGQLKNITQYTNVKDKVYTKEDYPRSTKYKTNRGYYTGDAIIRSLIDHSSSLEEDEVMIEQTYHIAILYNSLTDKDNYSYYSPHAVTMQELGLAEAYNHFYPNSPIATQASEVENKPVVMSLDEQENNNDNKLEDNLAEKVKVEDNEDFSLE